MESLLTAEHRHGCFAKNDDHKINTSQIPYIQTWSDARTARNNDGVGKEARRGKKPHATEGGLEGGREGGSEGGKRRREGGSDGGRGYIVMTTNRFVSFGAEIKCLHSR